MYICSSQYNIGSLSIHLTDFLCLFISTSPNIENYDFIIHPPIAIQISRDIFAFLQFTTFDLLQNITNIRLMLRENIGHIFKSLFIFLLELSLP